MRSPLRVGITGGIGSGKTTVCRLFAALGIPVYDADYWAKWLVEHDPHVREAVRTLLGDEAYDAEGRYNRSYVAQRVFSDPHLLHALNTIVHPAVERHSGNWHEQQRASGCPYTLKEAALLVESGNYRSLDALVVVTAPEAVRIQRVMQRDGLSEDAVRARMQRQMSDVEKIALADYVIVNDGHHALIPQVWKIHRALVKRYEDQKMQREPV
ncbi:MAG: dephospho-CoA kinase [Saprospiraceae bacterium]|nr:dephospho-CoA kinase [Saprospiraceae bacterium]MDW8484750.1 dephospho-CoA kinase [Saprospiraceae bacterium]